MYSVVLMAAMTAGAAEAPSCHWGGCCHASYSCCGCYGGYSSCYGCYGGYGGCYGGYGGCYGSSMCHGCYGCGGCFGGIYGTWSYSTPGTVYTVPAAGTSTEKAPPPKVTPQAKVIIQVPADAQVYFDDTLMKSTSEERAFYTPKLERGQAYYYNVKAVISRDGKQFEETKRVIVRAGDTVRESFRDTLEAKAKVNPSATPADSTATARR